MGPRTSLRRPVIRHLHALPALAIATNPAPPCGARPASHPICLRQFPISTLEVNPRRSQDTPVRLEGCSVSNANSSYGVTESCQTRDEFASVQPRVIQF